MIHNYKKLQGEEILLFKQFLDEYKEYDRVDLLIELFLQRTGTSSLDFRNRDVKIKNEKRDEIVIEAIPDSLKYCDGGKCTIDIFKTC